MDWTIIVLAVVFAVVIYNFVQWFAAPITSTWSNPSAHSYTPTFITASSVASFTKLSDPAELDLSLIVPAYNEELRLDKMMNLTMTFLRNRQAVKKFTYEIIIVDDGSSDATFDVATQQSIKYGVDIVRVMQLRRNQGKGGAVQQGMLHSRGRKLLMVDADGASRIEDYDKLENELIKITNSAGHGLVCGSRAHLQSDAIAQRAWYRNILMHGFHFLVSTLCVKGVRDTQCGFKLFNRPTALALFNSLHVRRWCFDVELLFIAQSLSIPIGEVAITWEEVPGSKLSMIEASLTMARDLIIIALSYRTGLWSLVNPQSIKKNKKI